MGWLIAGALSLLAVATLVQLMAGAYETTGRSALAALTDPQVWQHPGVLVRLFLGDKLAHAWGLPEANPLDTATLIVWNIRLPRVLVGLLVGINLALSGSIFQAVTRNELASPYLLGVSSGAGLAILLVLVVYPVLGPHLPLVAMLGGGGAFLLVYLIAWHHGTSPVRLVLAGVIVAAIAGSLQTAVFFLAKDINLVQNALAWTTGSLTGAGWEQVRMIAPWTFLSCVLSLAASRHLDVLLLGDPTARALGMSVERARFFLAGTAIMAAASSVAVAGLVGFVGLIVPHVVRNVVGSAHRRLLTGCLFAGPALLVSADAVARLLFRPVQVPVGIVTGVLGGLFFLYLMRRRQEIGKL
ncbi:MAG TPA: iron ABC transporter permease [Dongiaceae bacterium]|nr:iron ABC transporter permease [Dongiaceae bacterium]